MSELKAVHAFDVYEEYIKTGDDDAAQVYLKSEVDSFIDELKREHHKERHEYIDMVAQLKAKLVEQESENRKLKRALYKACANWADVVAFEETEGIGHDNSVAERWRKMERKCLKKAKEFV